MRILIDLDDIVFDLLAVWLERYNNDYDDSLTKADMTEWDMHKLVKPVCSYRIYEYLSTHIFLDLPTLPGAINAVNVLLTEGHQVRFCTTAPNAGAARDKLVAVEREFRKPPETIICRDKHWIQADLLIDDKPTTLQAYPRPGRTATIVYPHNQLCAADCKAEDYTKPEAAWQQILEFVEEIS